MNSKTNLRTYIKENYANSVFPDYSQNCLANIPHHIKYLHGIEENTLLKQTVPDSSAGIRKTIQFVLDGFGYKQWHEHQAKLPVLSRFSQNDSLTKLTSMFPSSTAVSITALSTGLTTQQHGLIEWWMYDDSSDQIITTLPFMPLGGNRRDGLVDQNIDPKVLVNSPTLYQDLANSGIKSYTLISADYATSAYSSVSYAGSEIVAHNDCVELFQQLSELLRKDEQAHFNVYWPKIDTAGHTHGPESTEYADEVVKFFDLFEAFLKTAPEGCANNTQIMVTADHGQIATDPDRTIWLDELAGLTENLAISRNGNKILPWGLQRDVFLKINANKLDETIDLLTTHLDGKALVLKSAEVLATGLFGGGEIHPDFLNRIGDLVVIPTGNNTIWYRHYPDEKFTFKGMHGGLTADEVEIPFASIVLSNLIQQ